MNIYVMYVFHQFLFIFPKSEASYRWREELNDTWVRSKRYFLFLGDNDIFLDLFHHKDSCYRNKTSENRRSTTLSLVTHKQNARAIFRCFIYLCILLLLISFAKFCIHAKKFCWIVSFLCPVVTFPLKGDKGKLQP